MLGTVVVESAVVPDVLVLDMLVLDMLVLDVLVLDVLDALEELRLVVAVAVGAEVSTKIVA